MFLFLPRELHKKLLFRSAKREMPDWSKEVTMANRKKNSVLMSQVVSKLLDSPSVKVPENRDILNLLYPTAQKSPDCGNTRAKATMQAVRPWAEWWRKYSDLSRHFTKTDKALILIAWVLLVLNVLAVMGNLKHESNIPLILHVTENTGFLFHIGVLAFGAFILAWVTWLYLKNRTGGAIAVPILIIIALSVTLVSFTKESDNVITNIRGLGRNLLCSFFTFTPVTTTPVYRVVSGILYSEDEPSAVVGDQIVHEGDALHGINVVKIYKDKVEFEKNGQRWTQVIEKRPTTY